MLRLLMSLGIVICSAVAGAHFSQRLVCRRDILTRFSDLLRKACALISYEQGDLTEVFSDNFAGYVFSRDRPFDIQWRELADSVGDTLSKEDIILLKNFADGLGKSDNDSQLKHIQLYITLLGERIARAQSDIDNKSKLYRVVPVSAGLLISILII